MSERQDADFIEHVKTWHGFTRLIISGIVLVVLVLVGMALTLL